METAVDMEVRDITICPICRSIYSDPKMLPCLHNFCLKCLETSEPDQPCTEVPSKLTGVSYACGESTNNVNELGQSSDNIIYCRDTHDQSLVSQGTEDVNNGEQGSGVPNSGGQRTIETRSTHGKSKCKICQTEYSIPVGGFSSLPSNSFIKQLTNTLASLSRTESPRPCETCPTSRNSVSLAYCIDCEQAMCDECKESHFRARVSQNHKCIAFGSQLESHVMKDRNCYCDQHPHNLLTMYCCDHKMTICYECAAVKHRNDNCTPLSEVSKSFESQLNDDLRRVDSGLAECKGATDKLDEIEKNLKQEVANTEATIDKSVSECMDFITKAGDTLRQKLSNWKAKNLDDIENKKREVQRFVTRIDIYRRLAEGLLQKGAAADLSNASELMKDRAKELDGSPTDCEGVDLNITRTAFRPTNLASLLHASGIQSAVGDLHFIPASQRCIKFSRNAQETEPRILPFPAAAGQGENAPTVEVDGILSLEDAVDVSALLETSTIGGERIQWQNFDENNKTLQVGFCDKIKYQLNTMTLEGRNLTLHWRHDDVKPFQAHLLMLINFEKELKNAGLQCDVRITRDGLFLRGSEESEVVAKIAVFDKIMQIIKTSPSAASELQRQLMRIDAVQEYVRGICQQRDIKATLANDPSLQICAFEEQENVKLENILPSLIKELEISLDISKVAAATLSDELNKRQEEMEFVIDPVEKKIRIACLDKEEVQIREFVEQYIRDNSMVEKRVSLSQQKKDYIWQHKLEEVYLLKENLQKNGGSYVWNEGEIALKGTCSSVDSADTQLRGIVDSLIEKTYTIDHPGGESFLTKTVLGKLILKGVESEDKAFVTVTSRAQSSPSTTDGEPAARPDLLAITQTTSSSACTILMRLTNNQGVIVTVVTGQIESQRVDAIVNSTTKNLRLDAGDITKSILAAAGSSIQDECRRKGSVELGKIVRTEGYNLPCKCVYHGAAMPWDGGKGKSKPILAELINNCLLQAHSEGLRSIAFPAIGTGTLLFPGEIVVMTFFEHLDSFSRAHPATSLRDIRLVLLQKDFTDTVTIISILESLISHGGSWRKFERRPLKPNPIETVLTILASSEKAADDVSKKIGDILKDQTAVDSIDSAPDTEAIGFLTNQQVTKIEALQSTFSVQISLESTVSSTHRLLIKGTPKDVAEVGTRVRSMIHNNS